MLAKDDNNLYDCYSFIWCAADSVSFTYASKNVWKLAAIYWSLPSFLGIRTEKTRKVWIIGWKRWKWKIHMKINTFIIGWNLFHMYTNKRMTYKRLCVWLVAFSPQKNKLQFVVECCMSSSLTGTDDDDDNDNDNDNSSNGRLFKLYYIRHRDTHTHPSNARPFTSSIFCLL